MMYMAFTSLLLFISYLKRCSLFKYNLSSSSFPYILIKLFQVFFYSFFQKQAISSKKIIEVIILYPCNKL